MCIGIQIVVTGRPLAALGSGVSHHDAVLPAFLVASVFLVAVFAARHATSFIERMRGRSIRRDPALAVMIDGRDVSLPLDARDCDLKTAILNESLVDAEPPDGAEEDMAAEFWFVSCNGKKVRGRRAWAHCCSAKAAVSPEEVQVILRTDLGTRAKVLPRDTLIAHAKRLILTFHCERVCANAGKPRADSEEGVARMWNGSYLVCHNRVLSEAATLAASNVGEGMTIHLMVCQSVCMFSVHTTQSVLTIVTR